VKYSSSCVFFNLNMIQHYSFSIQNSTIADNLCALFSTVIRLCVLLNEFCNYTFHGLGILANCLQFQISTEEIPPFFGPPLLPNEDFLEKIVGVVTSGSEMLINYKKGAL